MRRAGCVVSAFCWSISTTCGGLCVLADGQNRNVATCDGVNHIMRHVQKDCLLFLYSIAYLILSLYLLHLASSLCLTLVMQH